MKQKHIGSGNRCQKIEKSPKVRPSLSCSGISVPSPRSSYESQPILGPRCARPLGPTFLWCTMHMQMFHNMTCRSWPCQKSTNLGQAAQARCPMPVFWAAWGLKYLEEWCQPQADAGPQLRDDFQQFQAVPRLYRGGACDLREVPGIADRNWLLIVDMMIWLLLYSFSQACGAWLVDRLKSPCCESLERLVRRLSGTLQLPALPDQLSLTGKLIGIARVGSKCWGHDMTQGLHQPLNSVIPK